MGRGGSAPQPSTLLEHAGTWLLAVRLSIILDTPHSPGGAAADTKPLKAPTLLWVLCRYQAAEVLGVVPRPVPQEAFLETSAKVLHTRLGQLYPVLLLGQSAVIGAGCLLILCLRIRGRRREAAFTADGGSGMPA